MDEDDQAELVEEKGGGEELEDDSNVNGDINKNWHK